MVTDAEREMGEGDTDGLGTGGGGAREGKNAGSMVGCGDDARVCKKSRTACFLVTRDYRKRCEQRLVEQRLKRMAYLI